MDRLRRYAKAIAALVGGLITWATTYYTDNPNVAKWLGLVFAVATFLSVYQVPNRPPSGEPADVNISEQGHANHWAVIGILVVLIAIFLFGQNVTGFHPD